MTELEAVNTLHSALRTKKPDSLKNVEKHVNLANKRFGQIWKDWWQDDVPPQLEVDFVLAFSDYQKQIDEALIVAVEVEQLDSPKKNFFEGLHQVLAFSLFGFDALVLWHIMSEQGDENRIRAQAKAMNELITGLQLPITFFSTLLLNDGTLRCFSPSETSSPSEVDYVVRWLASSCDAKRNPLLQSDLIRRRRNTLKAMLRIPA